jgi:membrane-bound metal-dependent hydrolase YbcI (DUF457 family)
MYVFGHVGLTIAAARAADRDADLRWAAVLAVAPDILDKPGSRLWPALVRHNTRGFGHTALFSLFVLAGLLIWKRRPKTTLVMWGCYVGHFLLDTMWRGDNRAILFWPLLGEFPPLVFGPVSRGLAAWYILGEIAGLVLLVTLARRHGLLERPKLAAFLKSGRLA